MHHCARPAVPGQARTRPLVRRVPGHSAHDLFSTRFPDTTAAGTGPVPPDRSSVPPGPVTGPLDRAAGDDLLA